MLFHKALIAFPACVSLVLGLGLSEPSVKIETGTVIGERKLGVESFNGIPFAKPPVDRLRLQKPERYDGNFGTLPFNPVPDGCPQFILRLDPKNFVDQTLANITNSLPFREITKTSEDCLTLNIQRPVGTKAGDKLPVLFYIYGGAFVFGSNQLYSGAGIIEEAVKNKKPIVYVAINYRVGGFGFLGGKEVKEAGVSNLGYRDQRVALEWVADNIAEFGGDPDKVTIWGESAGSISVYTHTIVNGGDNTYKGKPLFRAGIMNSGTLLPANPIDSVKPQRIYDSVVSTAGCKGKSDTLECLRRLPTKELITAFNSVPGVFDYPSLDVSYLPRPDPGDNFYPESPEVPAQEGRFAKVPIIVGDQEDEGPLFSLVQSNLTSTKDLETYLQGYFLNADKRTIRKLVDLYPDTPIAGSPYDTGLFNEFRPEFKRLAALLGDLSFTLTRRSYLKIVAPQIPGAWSFLNTYLKGTPILGTFHTSDTLVNFFNIIPGAAGPTRAYYAAFTTDLDPNTAPRSVEWPKWTTQTKKLLEFSSLKRKVITDDFRQRASDFIFDNVPKLRL